MDTSEHQSCCASSHPLSIAPMIQWTDHHYRQLFRQISSKPLLYTEMINDDALLHNYNSSPSSSSSSFSALTPWLRSSSTSHPLAVQLGGGGKTSQTSVDHASVSNFASAASLVLQYGLSHSPSPFAEINVNSGCPSSKAVSRCFGADLMRVSSSSHTLALLRETVRRVGHAAPVSLKCRIGCEERYGSPGPDARVTYEALKSYVKIAGEAGVKKIIVHSRICVLNGFSTGKNRTVPPLMYDVVRRVKRDFMDFDVVINGGVDSLDMAEGILRGECPLNVGPRSPSWGWSDSEDLSTFQPDGCMIGRWAYNDVCGMWDADSRFYGKADRNPTYREVIDGYFEHSDEVERQEYQGKLDRLPNVVKPMHNVFTGVKGN
eukprot:CAMPEP_0118635156 /NCGR_PEP_ID=MMETSP0785-20121206/1927_1 /TAXON_ID=91992 /ORGANISM="Bolidomonas pacifica, Strain CCMP 1866" /LENGTH=375 /DNA_ID=CAMNT_0006526173 /DNA_START=179 /DNA_END=1303 /DNA_ORIENTATION=+